MLLSEEGGGLYSFGRTILNKSLFTIDCKQGNWHKSESQADRRYNCMDIQQKLIDCASERLKGQQVKNCTLDLVIAVWSSLTAG